MTFGFSCSAEFDFDLDYDGISNITCAVARAADETTGGDREMWKFTFHENEFSVSFPCECCLDRFIEIYDRTFRSEPIAAVPAPSTKRARGRSRPVRR